MEIAENTAALSVNASLAEEQKKSQLVCFASVFSKTVTWYHSF